jgi:hypothetical protein
MTLADDANLPVKYLGQSYPALTVADIGTLIESLPTRLVPRQLIPFVSVHEALKFGRSPYGLTSLMRIVSDKAGHDHAMKLNPGQQLTLAGRLTDRFYGADDIMDDDEVDDAGDPSEPESFTDAPASLPTSPT